MITNQAKSGDVSFILAESGIAFVCRSYSENTNHIIAVSLDDKAEVVYDYKSEGDFYKSEGDSDYHRRTLFDAEDYRKDFCVTGDRIYFCSLDAYHCGDKDFEFSIAVTAIEKGEMLFEGTLGFDDKNKGLGEYYRFSYTDENGNKTNVICNSDGEIFEPDEIKEPIDFSLGMNRVYTSYEFVSIGIKAEN